MINSCIDVLSLWPPVIRQCHVPTDTDNRHESKYALVAVKCHVGGSIAPVYNHIMTIEFEIHKDASYVNNTKDSTQIVVTAMDDKPTHCR